MFKHDAVVEEIRSEVSTPSFEVIDLANPRDLLHNEGEKACTWGTGCFGCSHCSHCSNSGCSCQGCTDTCGSCTNTFRNSSESDVGTISAQDLSLAVMS